MFYKTVIERLLNGDITVMNTKIAAAMNLAAVKFITSDELSDNDIIDLNDILTISNILYNNTSCDMLPLEDGVYDQLVVLCNRLTGEYPVGAPVVYFDEEIRELVKSGEMIKPIQYMDPSRKDEMLYYEELNEIPYCTREDFMSNPIRYNFDISNRRKTVTHNYPELVGTLDKCKFVMMYQAEEKGVGNDPNTSVLERDFFGKHIKQGVLHPNRKIRVIAELKYDGVSVEGDIEGAKFSDCRLRGDAIEGETNSVQHILGNYLFRHAVGVVDSRDVFGMKFEAIITKDNLERYNRDKGVTYKNCRTAISGIFSSNDGGKYVDYITLVPLATSLGVDRLTDIEFMNRYYHSGELLRYVIIEGNYTEVLWKIKKFVEEAEYMRNFIPFMYDGIVISYLDEDIINALGRNNAINKYSTAVKFNASKKSTKCRGVSFTVGQDGSITPMVHYDPIEFFGTIHTKTSLHSYANFVKLGLREGDILDVEYVNDVMCYVYKPENSANTLNMQQTPLFEFVRECPCCNTTLVESVSGKTVLCCNMDCEERKVKRVANMLDKLDIKDFSESYIARIGKYSLADLINTSKDDVSFLGDVRSSNFVDRMNEIKTKKLYDYEIVGSLGFTTLGRRKWKQILDNVSLEYIISSEPEELYNTLLNIKGVGKSTVDVIVNERNYFAKDLSYILGMSNVISSSDVEDIPNKKVIRFTGVRDKMLIKELSELGHDAGEGSVSKKTNILIVPYTGFTSSKTSKAGEDTVVIGIDDFKSNMNEFLK